MYLFWIKINRAGKIHLRIKYHLMWILKDSPKCPKKKYLWTKVISIGDALMSFVQTHRTNK